MKKNKSKIVSIGGVKMRAKSKGNGIIEWAFVNEKSNKKKGK